MSITLIASSIFSLISGAIYGYVGVRLRQRTITSTGAQRAWKMFTVWWYSIALGTVASGVMNLFAAFGLTNLALFVAITFVNIFLICLALWGLVYYLVYLFTGSSRSLPFLTLFYVICFSLLVYYIVLRAPIAVNVGEWNASLTYKTTLTRPFLALAIVLFLFLPQILSGAAYFGLYFQLHDATQKYRVLLVSWSILLWFLSSFAATISGLAVADWWQIVSRLIGIAAALGILLAYFPPGYFQQRFGVKSVSE